MHSKDFTQCGKKINPNGHTDNEERFFAANNPLDNNTDVNANYGWIVPSTLNKFADLGGNYFNSQAVVQ